MDDKITGGIDLTVPSPEPRWVLAVYALIDNGAGRYLILRRAPTSMLQPGRWDFPGGKLELGEAFQVGLRREVWEETGLEITIRQAVGAWSSDRDTVRVVLLLLEAGAHGVDVRLSAEHDRFEWIEPGAIERFEFASYWSNALALIRSRPFSLIPPGVHP
jgi:8-oxo-dGTP diphosphatase